MTNKNVDEKKRMKEKKRIEILAWSNKLWCFSMCMPLFEWLNVVHSSRVAFASLHPPSKIIIIIFNKGFSIIRRFKFHNNSCVEVFLFVFFLLFFSFFIISALRKSRTCAFFFLFLDFFFVLLLFFGWFFFLSLIIIVYSHKNHAMFIDVPLYGSVFVCWECMCSLFIRNDKLEDKWKTVRENNNKKKKNYYYVYQQQQQQEQQ